MLEKPPLDETKILDCLLQDYGVAATEIEFLPLGADPNTAVYRADGDQPYFVKLRSGEFSQASVTIPEFLSEMGLSEIISPIPTKTGELWADLPPYRLILYPFVTGKNGFEVAVTDKQRVQFGQAMRAFHTTQFPPSLTTNIPRETFSPRWRNAVKNFLAQIEHTQYTDPVASELAAFLNAHREQTLDLIHRAEKLATILQSDTPDFILCHGDIHGWNLLIDDTGNLFIVDWDTLIFAPKERDLMFMGSGLDGTGHSLEEAAALFYVGYGDVEINPFALAYYRYERIIEDIGVSCEMLLNSTEGGADRAQELEYVKLNFRPKNTIQIAYQTDQTALQYGHD